MAAISLFELTFLLIGVLFIGLLFFLLFGTPISQPKGNSMTSLAILIPIKNEAYQLPSLVQHLRIVLKVHPHVRVRILNDHSSDLNNKLISTLNLNDQVLIQNAGENVFGKKAVLDEAIRKLSDSWILFMDADTEFSKHFLNNLEKPDSPNEKCILIPLSPKKRKGIINAFFDLDFLSLHFSGLKSASLGMPLLANGACMLINREAYLESALLRDDWNVLSGDDLFAMFAIAKKFGAISVSASANVRDPVIVNFPSSFNILWHQRLRWIGKTGKIRNRWFRFVAITVLTAQIFILLTVLLIFCNAASMNAIALFLIVLTSEVIFLTVAAKSLNRKDLRIYIIPSVFIYPLYLLTLGIFSIFAKPKWK